MGIKTREELEAKLVAEMVAEQSEVTVFEPRTAIRGFITAVAGTIRELWNDLYRMQRKIFLNTSAGSDLDELGAERGIIRKGASSAGVLLTFNGLKGTFIPQETEVRNPSTRIAYLTQSELTIGEKNPDLASDDNTAQAMSPIIADTVWAVCSTAGSIGNSQVKTINDITPINGVSSVTNLSPARGGADAENDGLYRERIRNYISILNQGTPAFYEALCKSINNRVLRVKAKKDFSRPDTVRLIIVTSDGAPLSPKEAYFLEREIESRHRAFANVVCEDARFTLVTVSERIKLLPGYGLGDVFVRTADACADFFDFRNWEFGKSISVDNVFNLCYNIEGIDDIELSTFKVKSGSISSASVSQVLHEETITASGNNTITAGGASFGPGSLVNKFVRIYTGVDAGDTKQIKENSDKVITIFGNWIHNPVELDVFKVVELYRYSTNTAIFINEDSLPYFEGIEITDIGTPASSRAANGITNSHSR